MDPNGNHFSINVSFNDNALRGSGSPLPRSFTRAGHGRQTYGVFSRLSPDISPGKSFTLAHHERRIYGVSIDLSIHHSHVLNLDLFSLSRVGGNSRALLLAIVQGKRREFFSYQFLSGDRFLFCYGASIWETLESARQQ